MEFFKKRVSLESEQMFKSTQQIVEKTKPVMQNLEPDYQKRLDEQEQILRELTTIVTWIANHKRFEHIQEKLIIVHNLLDNLKKL